jgi:two-component system sensor histidine kinase KdpD
VRVRPVLFSLGAVALVSLAVVALKPFAPVLSLGVLYLFAVLPVAALWGLRYAVPVSILSMLVFNWFFLPPTHTFQLHDSENWVALAVYLVTAVSVSWLAARRRSLEREDVAKTAVLRSVSHDLRSPITAILTASEVAAGDVSDAERNELLESIRTQAARLDRLVANLLDLSRLEAGAAAPELEVWPVDGLVARALEAVGPGGERVDVSLPAKPLAVRVDAAQLERVLVNLLENALKASPAVSIAVASSNGDVVFRVADDGPGISTDERDVIFEPFARGLKANGSRGAGLGLAIARGFLEVNGGRLWLEPDDGHGATFAFALPSVRGPA